jgi:hypothetical protein
MTTRSPDGAGFMPSDPQTRAHIWASLEMAPLSVVQKAWPGITKNTAISLRSLARTETDFYALCLAELEALRAAQFTRADGVVLATLEAIHTHVADRETTIHEKLGVLDGVSKFAGTHRASAAQTALQGATLTIPAILATPRPEAPEAAPSAPHNTGIKAPNSDAENGLLPSADSPGNQGLDPRQPPRGFWPR